MALSVLPVCSLSPCCCSVYGPRDTIIRFVSYKKKKEEKCGIKAQSSKKVLLTLTGRTRNHDYMLSLTPYSVLFPALALPC
jgi:hypothetical protein